MMLSWAFFPENSNPLTANPMPGGLHRHKTLFSLSVEVEGDHVLTTSRIVVLGHVIKYSLWDGPDI